VKIREKKQKRHLKCPYKGCPRSYTMEWALKNHIKTHHNHGKEVERDLNEM